MLEKIAEGQKRFNPLSQLSSSSLICCIFSKQIFSKVDSNTLLYISWLTLYAILYFFNKNKK